MYGSSTWIIPMWTPDLVVDERHRLPHEPERRAGARLTTPWRCSRTIHVKLRASTLIQNGATTRARRSCPRHPRARASSVGDRVSEHEARERHRQAQPERPEERVAVERRRQELPPRRPGGARSGPATARAPQRSTRAIGPTKTTARNARRGRTGQRAQPGRAAAASDRRARARRRSARPGRLRLGRRSAASRRAGDDRAPPRPQPRKVSQRLRTASMFFAHQALSTWICRSTLPGAVGRSASVSFDIFW